MPVARAESPGARVIAHVDMDCFYVQVEQRKQPHLRGQPTAVVQYNSWKGGALIAVSYEARKCGVNRFMRGDEAKKVCPQIQLARVPMARGKADLSVYRNAGSEVVSILARKGRCERASIDEVYLDLTDAAEAMLAETSPESLDIIDEETLKSHILGLNGDGSDLKQNVRNWLCRSNADRCDKLLACGVLIVSGLRMQVLKETEFTCSAGIAHNKMLAKLASGMNKPAQQTVVPITSVKGLLESLPIKKMKQLGGKLGSSLQNDLGVNTVGELVQFSEEKLQECYGINTGTWLWNIARGISGDEVEGRLLPKSHGSGKSFPGPCALRSIASVEHWLNQLCEELSERLHSDLDQNKRIARTLTLHARAFVLSDSESDRKFPSKSCPLRYGAAKIKEDTLNLFQAGLREYLGSCRIKSSRSQHNGWGVTALSVSASKIVPIPSGTCSIMKYFPGQDQSCRSHLNDIVVPGTAVLSTSGNENYIGFPGQDQSCSSPEHLNDVVVPETAVLSASGLHPMEPPVDYQKETSIGHAVRSLDQQENKSEGHAREDTYQTMQSAEHQHPSRSPSKTANDSLVQETSTLSSSGTESFSKLIQDELDREFHEDAGLQHFIYRVTQEEQKRKKVKEKGPTSILRFFRSCNNSSSSSHKQEPDETVAEAKASSSSTFDFNSISGFRVPTEAELQKESTVTQTGTCCSMSNLGQVEPRREAWDYSIDEIDITVFNELPPEIQEEVRASLRPQKRPNVTKRGSSITHYFLPSKST